MKFRRQIDKRGNACLCFEPSPPPPRRRQPPTKGTAAKTEESHAPTYRLISLQDHFSPQPQRQQQRLLPETGGRSKESITSE